MTDQPRVSAIVATYNWPEALDLVLDSLTKQTYPNLEVIVADDGSKQDTRDLVAAWAAKSPVPIVHSWQDDDGFRLARSRNLAASKATGDLLIMLDGDCMLFPTFVETHVRNAERGWFTAGRRCFMRKWASRIVLDKRLSIHDWPRAALLPLALFGGSNRPFQLVTVPVSDERRRNRATDWRKAQGCNLGIWRVDFMRVGGFDEAYSGWGLEDTDLVLRLFTSGVRRITLEHADPVLHLWHKRGTMTQDNVALLERIQAAESYLPGKSLLLDAAEAHSRLRTLSTKNEPSADGV